MEHFKNIFPLTAVCKLINEECGLDKHHQIIRIIFTIAMGLFF